MKRHMQFPVAKAKKSTSQNLASVEPLPVCSRDTLANERVVAIFTGLTIEVCDRAGIEQLVLGGCFGQGTLSRSFPKSVRDPNIDKAGEEVIRSRQFERREEWHRKYKVRTSGKVRVLEDAVEQQLSSGAINNNQLKYALGESLDNPYPVPEYLSLMFEESLFLVKELRCLEVRTLNGAVMSEENLVQTFTKLNRNFVASYVGYVYLRSKNWVAKSGLKFGGDFILYQKGPQFFHASYIVLIEPYWNDEKLPKCAHYIDNYDFHGFNRIGETTAKDLLILEVHFPIDLDPQDNEAAISRMSEFKVSEVFPKHHNYAANRMCHLAGTSSRK
ncbi:uncharacterized protein LOC134213849 isoform X2 [Armigeres subalbatus]|uniref:uncharacterized protein LOC134213849 isoform X2 n=1 Tax=Armigeres subalbatus TaxID=124917 RepID=UPI002ED647DB